jgi:hypothetical protein
LPVEIKDESEEEFITEHYWGYTKLSETSTSEYGVEHPRWEVYETSDYSIDVDFDDVYGETTKDSVKFHPPIEFKAFVQVSAPENKFLGNSKLDQMEPGNIRISVYQSHLDELGIEVEFGDYVGYYETENRVRYYSVFNDS